MQFHNGQKPKIFSLVVFFIIILVSINTKPAAEDIGDLFLPSEGSEIEPLNLYSDTIQSRIALVDIELLSSKPETINLNLFPDISYNIQISKEKSSSIGSDIWTSSEGKDLTVTLPLPEWQEIPPF